MDERKWASYSIYLLFFQSSLHFLFFLFKDGEAHVVAGARAMMRYRNNKSVDGTGAGGVAVAAASAAAAGGGGQKGWSTGGANAATTGGPATQAAVGRYPAVGGATAGTAALGGQQRTGVSKVFLV